MARPDGVFRAKVAPITRNSRQDGPVTSMQVLAVCTGNIARSPAIERLLEAALSPTGVSTASAGVSAVTGHPITPQMATLLASVGARTADFAAQQLTERLVEESALILTATRTHRSEVVAMVPSAVRRTFTLLEFARLARRIPSSSLTGSGHAARLRSLVEVAPSYRFEAGQGPTSIEDPYGRPDTVYRTAFDTIFAATLDILDAVTR
jgi:protein-tyrosine phosphatase